MKKKIGLISSIVLIGLLLVIFLPKPASGQVVCEVEYQNTNDWGTGFGGTAAVTNNSGSTIDGWTFEWSFSGDQSITALWPPTNTWDQNNQDVTVSNPAWDTDIADGETYEINFNASYSGTNNDPTTFELNGSVCGAPTSVSLINFTNSQNFMPIQGSLLAGFAGILLLVVLVFAIVARKKYAK